MIKSFKHKGLELFYRTGKIKSIIPEHSNKIARILDRLDASIKPKDMYLPGFKLHKLTGKDTGKWSVWVNGNWRITFMFEGKNAILVNYLDYY